MQNMVGFRNLAVHNYQEIDQAIVSFVAEERCLDFICFLKTPGIIISI